MWGIVNIKVFIRSFCLLMTLPLLCAVALVAQDGTARIHGQVADPSGAVVPNATVTVTSASGKVAGTATSNGAGSYEVRGIAAGTYSVDVTADGFAPLHVNAVTVAPGQVKSLNAALAIQLQQQKVQVEAEATQVDTSPDSNASAIVIKGKDLDALSDDPDEMQNELQALAGPAAGPNGGEIYIDGFTGGQLPPKSAIREIRINQNPFSAEFDRLGYGRIEIFTKPGTDKLHGQLEARGNYSAFNAQNPLLSSATEPPYYSWDSHVDIGGPITKTSSYFFSAFARNQENQNIVDAFDLNSLDRLDEAFGNASSRIDINPRIDVQLGQANTLTVRYEFYRAVTSNGGIGGLTLPSQATDTTSMENQLQISDSLVLSKNLVDDIRFQYRRIRSVQTALSNLPTVSLQSYANFGGNNSQTAQDHQNDFELQDYFSGALGSHSLNFGARLRAYDDVNSTNAGSNGSYTFSSLGNYQAKTPDQYSYTNINNPVASATLFDAALFYQDDWKVNPRLTFSYGLRWESQNRISDKDDWAPRLAVAYALGRASGNKPAKTVIRAGYGWFYQRFTVPNSFGSSAGTPYIVQAIHQNGVNQQQFIQNSSNTAITYNPNQTTVIDGSSAGTKAPTTYSVDPHFHAANDMEAAIGVDRQLAKSMTGNITYVYSQGVHQYLTNNISAEDLFPTNGTYPAETISEPLENNLQYQSGGNYREHQVILSLTARYRRFSLFTNYTYSNAKGDTSGVTYVPSVASNPGLDYGRTSFDVHNRFLVFGNFTLPWQISASPFLVATSGAPFNITAGKDLTGNNQFNGRPTWAASCSETDSSGAPSAVQTPYGCFDTNPYGTDEKIIPYGLGTGPSNVSLNMRLSKVIGIGPRVEGGGPGGGGGGRHGGGPPGLMGGFSGNRGGPGRLDASTSRKYNLTLSAFSTNVFNHTNLGAPDGALSPVEKNGILTPAPFFNQSQSLASGFFTPTAGANRFLALQASFNF
jgi:hypothetical protein